MSIIELNDPKAEDRIVWTQALRDLSYLLEERELPELSSIDVWPHRSDHPIRANWWFNADEAATFAETLRKLPKAGPVPKTQSDAGTWRVEFDVPGWPVHATLYLAEVCELVETGEVEEYDDVEVVTPAETRTVTRTRPKMKRVCPDSLLRVGAEVEA